MSAKLNKIDLSVEFMAIWWEEQTLWDIPIVSRQKWKRQKFEKNARKISDFSRLITFCFKCEVFFQLNSEILKF